MSSRVSAVRLLASPTDEELLESTQRGSLVYGDDTVGEQFYEPQPDSEVGVRAPDQAFDDIEEAHRIDGRWDALVEHYLARIDTVGEVELRTELLRKIACVYEDELRDSDQALDALSIALEEEPQSDATLDLLERVAARSGKWQEVVSRVEGMLSELPSASRASLSLRVGSWCREKLSDNERARTHIAEALKLEPNSVAALTELGDLLDRRLNQTDLAVPYFVRALALDSGSKTALTSLERIYIARGQAAELANVLVRKLSILTDPDEVAATQIALGSLYETSLADPGRAREAYQCALDNDPSSLPALRGVARAMERTGDWVELVNTLEAELERLTGRSERLEAFVRIASLYEEHILHFESAVRWLERAVETDPQYEPAYVSLEQNYRRLGQWHDLIRTCSRHIDVARDPRIKVKLHVVIAETYADEIDEIDGAIGSYKKIIELEPENVRAFEKLSELYDAQGNSRRSIECLSRIVDVAPSAESLYRLGTALLDKQKDPASAEARYEASLELDPKHLPSITALRGMAIHRSDFARAATYLDREQKLTSGGRRRAELLVDLGNVYRRLGQEEDARLAWERAREADSDNMEASFLLLEVYLRNEEAAKAEPLLDRLIARAASGANQHDLQNRLGSVCLALGKDEKAKRAFLAANQTDPSDPMTRAGVAEACFRLREWAAAASSLEQWLLVIEERDSDARAHAHFRLGTVQREQGLLRDALQSFERALEADRSHRPTLEALVRLHSEAKDWGAVVTYKYRVLDGVRDEEERFALLVEIGDLWREKIKDPEHAIYAFEDALQIHPDSHPMFLKLLGLYQATEKWTKLIGTLEALLTMEREPLVKSKFLYTLAQLYRDKQDDPARAVELFEQALDLDPTLLEAFERINRILTSERDWTRLERAFRKMIHRQATVTPKDANVEYHLWHGLGLIHRDRLKSIVTAAECFKMAASCKSQEMRPHEILAELYEVGEYTEGAVAEYAAVLELDSMRPDPYRGLFRLYMRLGEYDRAWCASAALAFLGKSSDDEKRFFEAYRPYETSPPRGRLDNELWIGQLFHRDDNVFVGKIFDLITPAAMALKTNLLLAAQKLPALEPRFKESETQSTLPFTRALVHTAYVLGLPRPDLYIRKDLPGGLVAVPSTPPASVAGRAVLAGHSALDLAFMAGKHVSGYRGEHYIRSLFPRLPELKVLLFAAMSLVLEGFAVPSEIRETVSKVAGLLAKHLHPTERESLALVVTRFVADGGNVDLKRWMAAADLTGCRAGLLVSGDLESAKRILYAEPQLPGELSPADKMKELLAFSVSEAYFTLRQALRITIGS